MRSSSDIDPAIALLYGLPRFADIGSQAYKPGLHRVRTLLGAMGNPQNSFPSVHIGGTNGKGSTASVLAAIGTSTRRRVGLHTSPHLVEFGERMRIDGRPAPEAWIVEAVERHRGEIAAVGASFFEASVALSFLYFAEQKVDAAVVEVGMGGRLDATNVLTPVACAVTHIGLDHTEQLGDSPESIAREKGGIAKPGVPLLSAVRETPVVEVLRETVLGAGADFEDIRLTTTVRTVHEDGGTTILDLRTPAGEYRGLRPGLPGAHQVWNTALAVRLAETAWPDVGDPDIRTGVAEVQRLSGLRGRCEVLSEHPRIIADVAHNRDGWRVALEFAARECNGRLFVLVGMMADKDPHAFAELLGARDAVAIPVDLDSPRGLPRSQLTEELREVGLDVVDAPTVREAVDLFRNKAVDDDVLLVTGSHLTVAALLGAE